jgi:TonB-linked SusC/RagA family outer membrane protein
MRYTSGLTAALLATVLSATAAAQERPISGTVRDSVNRERLEYIVVSVRGSRVATVTGANGTWVIPNAPSGEVGLIFRGIGYRSREVNVGASESTVDVALMRDVFRLEEIVVTGQATGVLRRNLANAIATVNASDLGSVPAASVEQMLQGKVAGADIQTNSGAPGGGIQVRLRGITSINADAQPLYVVDGVIMSDVAIPSNQNEITAAASGSNPSLTQDGQVNRIADLNPNDIETIEILKGASASAIYGGRASNGVVIITTRRGQAGAPRINFTQRFGRFGLSNKMHLRRFGTVAEVDAAYGPGAAAAANWSPGQFFDHEEELADRHNLSLETSASISGGNETTRYFASGTVKNDEGIIANTGFQRQAIRLNLDQRLSRRLNASISTNLLHTLAQRGLTNNDNSFTSFYMNMAFAPSFQDLRRRPDGTFPATPVFASNPLQTAALMRNDESVWRFVGAGRLQWDIAGAEGWNLRWIGNGGVDFFTQENKLFFPPELYFEDDDGLPGTSLLSNSNNLNLNLDGSLVHNWMPAGRGFTATTSAGVQYARRGLGISRITSRNLTAGQQNVDAGTAIRVRQIRQRVLNLGFYLQEEVLMMRDRLLLTAGFRADQSSLNAESDRLFFFPKASASYRLQRPFSFVDELKLRLAYGESGNEPLYGQRFTPLDATSNIGGLPGLAAVGTTGSPDLRPERQREIETGIDATFFHSRAGLEFSIFQKNISDLLLQRTLAPSSGFDIAIFNAGSLRTRGVEIAASAVPIRTARFEWFVRSTFALNRSTITDLPVPSFITTGGGFGTSIGAFRIEEGASPTQIVGNDTLPDGSSVVVKIGDANPDFRMAFTNDVTYQRWGLHFLLDWQHGSNILNLTKLLWDFGQVSEDYADPSDIPGMTVGEKRLAGFQVTARNYMESASFLKLREVTLTYDMPPGFAQRLWGGVRSARISVSGRNLFTSTPYTGLDPEVSNFGNRSIERNLDVGPFPPSRSFWFSIDLGF